ncbi:MAG: hypothetical protein J7L82_07070 [Staphylothermus sp.]|nr:hypothetical protein [Staphylothermus sp.]
MYRGLSTKIITSLVLVIILVAVVGAYLYLQSGQGEVTTTTSSSTSVSTTTTTSASSTTSTTSETTTSPLSAEAKNIIVVAYKNQRLLPEDELVPYSNLAPSFYRDPIYDALIQAGRYTTDPEVREVIYKAIQKYSNNKVPMIWLVQIREIRVYWDWVENIYFHPTLDYRVDDLSKSPDAPNPDTLVIGETEEGHSLDPAVTYWGFDWRIIHQIYETLVTYERDSTEYVVPQLAVAWAHNEEGDEWYFVIRGNVVFYDPWNDRTIPLTPEDVIFSFQRVVLMHQDPVWLIDTFIDVNNSKVVDLEDFKNLLASQGLVTEFKGSSRNVKSFEELLSFFGYNGPVAGVVKLKLKFPYAGILSILATKTASIVSKQVVMENGGVVSGEENEFLYDHPVGTGPYYLVKWEHQQYYELRANPYYWKGEPKIKRILIKLIGEDETRILQLKKGDIDIGVVPPNLLSEVEGVSLDNHNLLVKSAESFWIRYVVPNCQKEPFNNEKFRQALAWAIPYDEIIATVFSGHAIKDLGVIPKGMLGYQDDDVINYTFNPDKALELLEESGVDTSGLTITIMIPQGYTELEQIATILQASWNQIFGIEVKIQTLSRPVFNEKIMSGDFDVYVLGWGPDYIDPDDYAGPLQSGGYEYDWIKAFKVSSLEEAAQYIDVDNAAKVTYDGWLILVGESKQ